MRKKKTAHQGKNRDNTETGISLSIIVPLAEDEGKLSLFMDSLQKIRKPLNKDYEVVLPVKDPEAGKGILSGMPGLESLLEKELIRLVAVADQTGTGEAIRAGIENSSRDNILVFEPGTLERSFNFDEFFNIHEEELSGNNLLVPEFREQETGAGRNRLPVYLMKRPLAEYLFGALPLDERDYQKELLYRIGKLGIEAVPRSISQQNPFGPPQKSPGSLPERLGRRVKRFWDWYLRIPLGELRSAPHRKYPFLDLPSYFRSLFVITAFLIAVALPLMSLGAGQSGDDEKHYVQAEKVYNYFATGGKDKSSLNDPRLKLNFYGQSLDLLTYVINKAFKIDREYEARHFIIGITGFLCILFAGLLAARLGGYRAGWLTMIGMFLAPRYLGHAMNNPMDVPFALGYIFTLYHAFRFLEGLPRFSNRHAFWIMMGIAFTISIRIGGLLLVPYLFMFAGLYVLLIRFGFKTFSGDWFRMVWRGLLYLGIISVGGYLISLIPWPYGLQKPFKNPFQALRMMENITVAIKVLFNGSIYWSNRLPWYYISMNILYTVPVALLAGFLLNIPLYPFYRKQVRPIFIFFLFFVVLFPMAYVIYKKSNVYGGWRHLLFIFPAMAVLSGFAWDRLIRLLKNRTARIVLGVLLVGGIVQPLLHIVRNHPLEYIYFNELLGVKKAYGRFETDYYMNSLKPGADWLIANRLVNAVPPEGKKIRVATNGSVTYYLRHLKKTTLPIYTRYYDRGEYNWDYAVYFCNYIDPYQLTHGLWPPSGTIKTIDVDGVPVCAVVERKSKADMEAIEMVKNRDYTHGIPALEEVNRRDTANEIVKLRLAEAYLQTGQLDKVHRVMDECLRIYPDYDKALNMKGLAYLQAGDINQARSTFLHIIRVNYRFVSAYHNLGLVCMHMDPPDVQMAINYFQQAIQTNRAYRPSYMALAAIYRQLGRIQEARQYENAANAL